MCKHSCSARPHGNIYQRTVIIYPYGNHTHDTPVNTHGSIRYLSQSFVAPGNPLLGGTSLHTHILFEYLTN